jgi:hypothetical protein
MVNNNINSHQPQPHMINEEPKQYVRMAPTKCLGKSVFTIRNHHQSESSESVCIGVADPDPIRSEPFWSDPNPYSGLNK